MKLHEVSTFKLSPPFTTPGESKRRIKRSLFQRKAA
jgi:hypothetical protein